MTAAWQPEGPAIGQAAEPTAIRTIDQTVTVGSSNTVLYAQVFGHHGVSVLSRDLLQPRTSESLKRRPGNPSP